MKQHSSEYIDFVELIETALVDTEEWLGAVFKLSGTREEDAPTGKEAPPHRETSLGLIAVDWNYEQHTTCYSANRRDYFLRIPASFAKAVEWYFDRYRLLKVQQNDLMEFGLYGWYVHTLETLMDIISPRNKEAKEFQLTIVEELSKLYEDHFMWDDHKRIRKQYYKYSCEKDIFDVAHYADTSDGRKQLAYCQRQLWRLERFSPKQPDLLVSIQSLAVEVIVKLRQMVEQCIQRFASEMIYWPNREQQVSDKDLKGLYGATTMEDFDAAIRKSKLGSHELKDGKMDLATQYRKVRDALLEAQPFNNPHLDHWWPIIKLISNICKHSEQLEIFFDDELRIPVPLDKKKTIMKSYSVCELIRAALRGFRKIVMAIDESKKETDDMHKVASTGKGSLRKYLDAGIAMDRMNMRKESCYHLVAKRGDLRQLEELFEDKQALQRALYQQDLEQKWTPLHHMYKLRFLEGVKLVQDNVDEGTFLAAMSLQDKDGKTPDQVS